MVMITEKDVGRSFKTNNGKTIKILSKGRYAHDVYHCKVDCSDSQCVIFYYHNGRLCGKRGDDGQAFKEWVGFDNDKNN